VSRWNGAAILADEKTLADFEKDLNSAIEQAQQLLSAEQQDYYDKLSTEFPDLLETVAKAAASVKALITSYVPSAASVGDNAAAGLKARDDLVKALDTRTQVSAILAELEKGRPEPDAADFADWKAKKVVWEAMKTTAEKEIIAAHASRIALTS
jgi:hypothetical protein